MTILQLSSLFTVAGTSAEEECHALTAHVKHGDALFDVCRWAYSTQQTLPNLLVEQTTKREKESSRTHQWNPIDEITCGLRYENGKLEYLNVKSNGKPVSLSEAVGQGSWSTGEYFAILVSILQSQQEPHFTFERQRKEGDHELLGYPYKVKHSKNQTFTLRSGGREDRPGFQGELWIDAANHQLVELERNTNDVNPGFPITYVGSVIYYDRVALGDGSTLVLPVRSTEYSCDLLGACWRNTIRFDNWRKFGVNHRIDVDDGPPVTDPTDARSPR